jgi:hypothetical protein
MTPSIRGVGDRENFALTPRELSRIIGDQLEDPDEANAPGLMAWVESRWAGRVHLTDAALDRWIAGWRAEIARRKETT